VVRVVVLADTHIRAGRARRLPALALAELAHADVILHAGDIVGPELLDELRELAPVHAVLGNNDRGLDHLPAVLVLEFEGVRVGMIHDSGPRRGRPARLRRLFPDSDVVVFGHSHEPVDEVGIDGQRLFNPGSPTERRRQPHHTIGVLEIRRGELTAHHVIVGP
jgi:uncharacterized protein